MIINEFKMGDIVVITESTPFLEDYASPDTYIGLICEVTRDNGAPILDRSDTKHLECVLNDMHAKRVNLRPATDREKFLYKVYQVRKA